MKERKTYEDRELKLLVVFFIGSIFCLNLLPAAAWHFDFDIRALSRVYS